MSLFSMGLVFLNYSGRIASSGGCFGDLTSRTQKRKPSGTGWLLYKSQEVLSVLRQVFSGGRYRQQ